MLFFISNEGNAEKHVEKTDEKNLKATENT